ncbi:SGNH/GDSL hydrolase family protein [Rhodococcus sp. NPDC006774]|uniref:SGNH/GDSL hydrolase family protein n=1 Tax=Rhodococcus sp. NPDC006774 TaxID=3157186 RepID=UPI0033E58115
MAWNSGRRELSRKAQTLIGVGLAVVTVVAVGGGLAYDRQRGHVDVSGLAPVEQPELVAETAKPVKVNVPTNRPLSAMIVGDSITVGVGATVPENGWAPTLIRQLERTTPVEASISAVSGANTAEQMARTDFSRPQDLVVLELGTNDNGNTADEPPTDVALLRQQYTDLVTRVRATSPDAALICLGGWLAATPAVPIDAVIKQACYDNGGKFVELTGLYQNNALRGPEGRVAWDGPGDNFHPNDDGMRRIQQLVTARYELAPSGDQ